MGNQYIHGSSATERDRLALMNRLINPVCLEALGLAGERRVLDVGAGTGLFTRLMAQRLPADAQIVAVEIDPDQVRAAKQSAAGDGDGCAIDFRIGDAADLPLEPDEWGSMDLAHTRYLLEHVRDPLSVVRTMVAALRPGGRIVILDDDHELLRLWPEPDGVMAAWTAYYGSYASLETDARVGRKLAGLIHEAGARPSRITQLFYGACSGSEQFPDFVDNLVGQLQGARNTVLSLGGISPEAYDAGIENFIRFKSRPDAALWYVINWAEGQVPV
jgi:SAM-dependent methyltransferase